MAPTTTRKKRRVNPALRNRAEFDETLELLVRDILMQRDLQNRLDEQVTNIRVTFAPDLDDCAENIEDRMKLLQEYVEVHPEIIPADRKSAELTHAVIGFRTGMPALKTKRGWTWDTVLDAMREIPILKQFIRTKETPDKEAMIAKRDELVDVLPLVGLEVKQSETFYVEPRLTDQTDSVSTTETKAA
jgi:phage host-nuclease inhibitor protein Gam